MTRQTQLIATSAEHEDYNESIIAALLDALCSPHLYEIDMRNGELFIKPRPHMHWQAAAAGADPDLLAA
jgi:hypothetical protein